MVVKRCNPVATGLQVYHADVYKHGSHLRKALAAVATATSSTQHRRLPNCWLRFAMCARRFAMNSTSRSKIVTFQKPRPRSRLRRTSLSSAQAEVRRLLCRHGVVLDKEISDQTGLTYAHIHTLSA